MQRRDAKQDGYATRSCPPRRRRWSDRRYKKRKIHLLLFYAFLSRSCLLSVNAPGLLANVCITCRIKYDGRPLHWLLFLPHYNVQQYLCVVVLGPQGSYLSIKMVERIGGEWVCWMSTGTKVRPSPLTRNAFGRCCCHYFHFYQHSDIFPL